MDRDEALTRVLVGPESVDEWSRIGREEALKLLRTRLQGVAKWNRRRLRSDQKLDLERANLSGLHLHHVNLRGANLEGANLRGAYLVSANLNGANLRRADLREANLSGAQFVPADLVRANLSDANLTHAYLDGANLTDASLCRVQLRHAYLGRANLSGADIRGADLHEAHLTGTVIACDLSEVLGLDAVKHHGPSFVHVNSIRHFKDELPEKFLRGCGLQEEEIAYFRSRVGQPIRFYSCFISHSTADDEFAKRLYNDFQAAGIRCWKWDDDARTGQSLWGEIDRAIRVHDKLVLIASESSLRSPAVNREIERAICQEDDREKRKQAGEFEGDVNVLFPVKLDDFILKGWEHERKVDVTKKVIADASNWQTDPSVYASVRDKLIRDLQLSR